MSSIPREEFAISPELSRTLLVRRCYLNPLTCCASLTSQRYPLFQTRRDLVLALALPASFSASVSTIPTTRQSQVWRCQPSRCFCLSMGGGESLGIGLNHLELFSYVGGFSAGIRTADFQQSYGKFVADPQTANRKLHLLWLGCGSDDSLFAASESLSKMLDEAQIKHVFHKSDGAHTWINWRRYLNEFAPLLF